MPLKPATCIDTYQKALDEGVAAAFVGAGLSVPAGFVDWKELLREIAEELDLDVDDEADLIALAQYHVNHARGRGRINQKLIEEFTKDASLTGNHRHLAKLPLECIWTTNYDHLLESALGDAGKRVDKKVTKEHLALTKPKRDVVLYKMHGDVDRPDEAVLTKADYECYELARPLFSEQLVVCGMGLGIGDSIAMGAIEAVYLKGDRHLDERTVLRPFPQVDPSADRDTIWARNRQFLLERARSAIFVFGNKLDGAGNVVAASGVLKEYELARSLGVYPIPVGATGYAARQLADEVLADLDSIYGPLAAAVKPDLQRLQDAHASDPQILEAIARILKAIAPK